MNNKPCSPRDAFVAEGKAQLKQTLLMTPHSLCTVPELGKHLNNFCKNISIMLIIDAGNAVTLFLPLILLALMYSLFVSPQFTVLLFKT